MSEIFRVRVGDGDVSINSDYEIVSESTGVMDEIDDLLGRKVIAEEGIFNIDIDLVGCLFLFAFIDPNFEIVYSSSAVDSFIVNKVKEIASVSCVI